MKQNKPIVTVVTVTFNAEEYLEKTILSVIEQDYKNIEYIIVDGGSTDKTIEIIKKYEEKISFWISEPDEGIYDAMNKGVKYANGEFVNFMNAGDVFFDNTVCSRIFSNEITADLIYGDTIFYDNYGNEDLVKAKSLDKLWEAMIFNHNSLFAKKDLLVEFPFDLNNKIVADSKFVIDCYSNAKIFFNANITINKYLTGGFSDELSILRTVERWKLVSDYKIKDQRSINEYYFRRLLNEEFFRNYISKSDEKNVNNIKKLFKGLLK